MEYDFTVLRNNAHASIQMLPEKFAKISRKVNDTIKKESFEHLEFNTNPTFNDAMVEALLHRKPPTRQFVIKDLASSGKTTQLMSMAKALILRLKNDRGSGEIVDKVVHYCSMQNYSSNHAMVASDDDLWDMILECHQSPDWAKEGKRMSFDDFSKLHKKRNVTPILLIDTLDLLTYGMSEVQASQIASCWSSLVKKMHSEGFLVVWTSRPDEYEELVKLSGLDQDVRDIKLPYLDFYETKKRISTLQVITPQGQKRLEQTEGFHEFMTTMVITFPILSRLLEDKSRDYSLNFLEHMMKLHTKMKDSLTFDEAANPVLWVRDEIGKELPVDVYYECLTKGLFDFVSNTIDDSNITRESVSESWQEFIEIGFLEKSLNPHILHGARLKIPKDYSHSKMPELMEYVVEVAERRGLVNIQPKFIEFTHQLYAEYCIFKQASKINLLDEVQTFPSVRLRSIGSLEGAVVNDDLQHADLFKQWYLPFFLFNDALRKKSRDSLIVGEDWAWVNEKLKSVYGKEDTENEHDFLNPEKTGLARNIEFGALKDKMIAINGPPGTGKSSFASKWFHLKGDEFEQLGSKPNGTFISLSENLTRDYVNKFEQYFKGISPPVELNSISVDGLLRRLSNILNNESKTQMEFNGTILSERYFIDKVRDKADRDVSDFGKMARKNGHHSLWNEFLTQLHDARSGLRVSDIDEFTEHVTNDDTSIFYEFNYKSSNKAEEDAQTFFSKMKEIFPSDEKGLKTRGEHAGILTELLMKRFYSDSDNDEIIEQILPLRSDVLVIDEVQDLGTQVIKLCLLLHRGEIGQVIVLGDDEQTLDLEPFDWDSRFKEVGEGIYVACDEYITSNYHGEDHLNLKRWKQEHVGKAAEGRQQLKHVERNVPSIVYFIKESYMTSVFNDPQLSRQKSGAAVIEPGPVSQDRLGQILGKDKKSFHGVYHFEDAPLSIDNFVELAKAVYNSDVVLSIIAPSENIHRKLAEILSEKEIKVSLWHPNSIKGLEYERVLAISPWSIETSLFNDLKEKTWETAVARYIRQGEDNNSPWRHKFEKIAKQRRRHANVMISRPKNVLVLLDLDMSTGLDNYNTEGYELTNTHPPDIKQWLKKMEGDVALGVQNRVPIDNMSSLIDMVKSDEEIAAQNYVSVLADMIASEKDHRNIQLQASHIVNLMKRKGVDQSNVPFLLIGSFMGALSEKWSILEVLLFNHEFRSRKLPDLKGDNSKKWKESLRQIQNKFHIIANDANYDDSRDSVTIPVNIYHRFEKLQEELRSCVQDIKYLDISQNETRLIRGFIEHQFFPEALESDEGNWIRIASMLNLKTGSLIADNNQPAYVLGMFKNNFYSDFSETQFEDVAKRRLNESESVDKLKTRREKINRLIPYEAAISSLKQQYEEMERDELFALANERGWKGAEKIQSTRQNAIEFLVTHDKEKEHMEVLKGDWWAKGARMLRANTIKPADAKSVLKRMKKQFKDPSTKVTSLEQLECIYELIIKTAKSPRRPVALEMLKDLQELAKISLDIERSLSLNDSSFGEKWDGIIAADILRHRMELNHLLSSDNFNIHNYFVHDLLRRKGRAQNQLQIELDTIGNLSFVVSKCKSFIDPTMYDKLCSYSKNSILQAVIDGDLDDWKYLNEKSIERFLKQNSEALKNDKNISIDDILHDDIIGLLPGEFGKHMLEEQFEDVSPIIENDMREEFVSITVSQSLLRNYLLFKTGSEYLEDFNLPRKNKNFFSAISNSLFGFEKKYSGKVNFQHVKELIFNSGEYPEITDSDPILDIGEKFDNSHFVEWMGRLAKENPSFDAIGSLRLKAMEDLQRWLKESKKKGSPHEELRSRDLDWMVEADVLNTIKPDSNALLDYYVREHVMAHSKSSRYTKFKEEFIDVIRKNDSLLRTHYMQNHPIKYYHYRFGNKEESIRIPLASYMAIEILAEELEVETLDFILKVINQYWLNTTTKTFHMSTLVRGATSALGCNEKYVEMMDSEKLICSRAVSSLIDIVRDISGVHQSAEARDRIFWTLYRCNTYNEQDQNEQKKLFSLVEFLDQNVNKILS